MKPQLYGLPLLRVLRQLSKKQKDEVFKRVLKHLRLIKNKNQHIKYRKLRNTESRS